MLKQNVIVKFSAVICPAMDLNDVSNRIAHNGGALRWRGNSIRPARQRVAQ